MFGRRTLLGLFLLAGCSTSNTLSQAPEPTAASLVSKVGQEVTLRGRFDGPGKVADYIVIANGEHVYLTGESQPDPNSTKYGTEVVIRGKLQHYIPPPADFTAPVPDEPIRAIPGEHYFIDSAVLVGVPQL